MAGADPVSNIITELVAIEAAITAPTGMETPTTYDELTAEPGAFPCFLNVPKRSSRTQSVAGAREFRHEIDIYLIFGQDAKYASREQRAWVAPVLDAFDHKVNLAAEVQIASIDDVSYEPVMIADSPYVAITFTMYAITSEPFAFSV